MILPNKYIQENHALIGLGATVLSHLSSEQSLSSLWESIKKLTTVNNFERFILALDLLFVLGLVDFKNNKIIKVAL